MTGWYPGEVLFCHKVMLPSSTGSSSLQKVNRSPAVAEHLSTEASSHCMPRVVHAAAAATAAADRARWRCCCGSWLQRAWLCVKSMVGESPLTCVRPCSVHHRDKCMECMSSLALKYSVAGLPVCCKSASRLKIQTPGLARLGG
jgi:hypothetical protein